MHLAALESLVVISETQSFAEAARRLGISQSTISMQIKSLESELRVPLFDRSVRPPTMTPAALSIIQSARTVVSRVEDIRRSAEAEAGLRGRLRLGVIPTATLALLPVCTVAIIHRHPGIRITVRSGLSAELVEQVRERQLDAIVVTEPTEIPVDLQCRVVLRERLAIASGGYRSQVGLDGLTDHPFIRFNRRIGVGAIVDDFLAAKGIAPAEFMELDSVEAIVAMVERGLGVAIVPERSIGEGNRHRVRLVPLEDADAYRNVSLMYRVDTRKSQLLDVVLEAFRAAARQI